MLRDLRNIGILPDGDETFNGYNFPNEGFNFSTGLDSDEREYNNVVGIYPKGYYDE